MRKVKGGHALASSASRVTLADLAGRQTDNGLSQAQRHSWLPPDVLIEWLVYERANRRANDEYQRTRLP